MLEQEPAARSLARIGELITQFHRRGVIVRDPVPGNWIRSGTGKIYFVDFGGAKIFRRRGVYFYLHVGRELLNIFRTTLRGDVDLYRRFTADYFAAFSNLRARERGLIRLGFRYWSMKQRHRS